MRQARRGEEQDARSGGTRTRRGENDGARATEQERARLPPRPTTRETGRKAGRWQRSKQARTRRGFHHEAFHRLSPDPLMRVLSYPPASYYPPPPGRREERAARTIASKHPRQLFDFFDKLLTTPAENFFAILPANLISYQQLFNNFSTCFQQVFDINEASKTGDGGGEGGTDPSIPRRDIQRTRRTGDEGE